MVDAAAPARTLVVNADDFGQSAGINAGIVEAHERGIVTSASLMVRWPAATEAAALAHAHPRLGVGLHLDLGEWAYREGSWESLYQVAPTDDPGAVEVELGRQLERFRELTGRDPTHIDSHQHAHRAEPVRSVVCEAARAAGIPVRHFTKGIRYSGDFYGQGGNGYPVPEAIGVESLLRIIDELPAGITELACHPGDASGLDSMYRAERMLELRTLCDPRVREAIARAGIRLASFAEVAEELSLRARASSSA
jgi:chitin disaccharide deacetylase